MIEEVSPGSRIPYNVKVRYGSLVFSADHAARRVHLHALHDVPIHVHVFGQHDDAPHLLPLIQYPGVASGVPFPPLTHRQKLTALMIDKERRLQLKAHTIDDHLYFAHHHYANRYVYGQLPALVFSTSRTDTVCAQLYVGAPIFDENGRIVSVVTDHTFDDAGRCVVPLPGQTVRGCNGFVYLDGRVWFTHSEDTLCYESIQNVARIDVYVTNNATGVIVEVIYRGQVLNRVEILGRFAGNVLIN
jgi:Nucleopolyhedrovirus p26 protein